MSERDCPDERMVEWIESKRQHGYYVLTREELDERIDEACRDAHAEGRKDEREDTIKTLENELTFSRGMAKENGGNPRYDYYADCIEMLINDFKDAA